MDRIKIKHQALSYVREGKPSPVTAGIILAAITLIFSILTAKLIGVQIDTDFLRNAFSTFDVDSLINYFESQFPTPMESFLAALLRLLESILTAGLVIFVLNVINNADASYWNLLDGFGIIIRLIILEALTALFIALWSLLLVIPGIIAFYRYRFAIFILIENPDMGVMDCIRESKRLTKGFKWELFVLDLSFIGWAILCSLPYIGYIARIWFLPFYNFAFALYYKQRLVIDRSGSFEPGI